MLFKQRKIWQLRFALSAAEGLEMMAEKTFDVVVSDMRMPGMDGIELLTQVKDKYPDTVRMMLTGNTDLETAIAAVNAGNVFRFLTKPCEPEMLVAMLEAGIEQHRLVTAERELLTQTLSGSVKLLTEVLSMADPQRFGQALWLRDSVRTIAHNLKIQHSWEIVLAAMLGDIGCITLPPAVISRAREGGQLSPEEADMVVRVPQIGYDYSPVSKRWTAN
jgi:response regulator RpfG family c-di-GMP phosphodiesterase